MGEVTTYDGRGRLKPFAAGWRFQGTTLYRRVPNGQGDAWGSGAMSRSELSNDPVTGADDLGLPDYLFLRMDELWIIDHQEKTLYCCA